MSGGHGHGDEPPDPGAGNQLVWPIHQWQFFELHAFTFKLVTSATAGNRTVGIEYNDGTIPWWFVDADDVQVASRTVIYCFSTGPLSNFETGPDKTVTPISSFWLEGAWKIATAIDNLKGNDIISEVTIHGHYRLNPQRN